MARLKRDDNMKPRKPHIGYVKTKLFSVHRVKMLQQLFLMEYNPYPERSGGIAGGGIDPSSGVFIEWLLKRVNEGKPFPNNRQIQCRVDEYNLKLDKAKQEWVAWVASH